MTLRKPRQPSDLVGYRVLILTGKHEGEEGVCLGRAANSKRWAISPDASAEVLELIFDKEFGLLVDLSSDPKTN